MQTKKTRPVGIATIDLSLTKSKLLDLIVKACEDYGFFKVTNHGVSKEIVSRLEEEATEFFAKTATEKQQAAPARPFGYGSKNIGFKGDIGELEYLLLRANPSFINEASRAISNEPLKFSRAVNDYIQGVRELTCRILDLVSEGLGVSDKFAFSRFITDVQNDSVLRLNYYPPVEHLELDPSTQLHKHQCQKSQVGFGEHSDPQIMTIFRSNDVEGLQIASHNGSWISVPPNPMEFYVIVGDALQVLTNGRFTSVRHRAMTNPVKARISIMYFGAPPLDAWITPLPEMVSFYRPNLYKPFTWEEYKQVMYSLKLGDTRLNQFKIKDAEKIASRKFG